MIRLSISHPILQSTPSRFVNCLARKKVQIIVWLQISHQPSIISLPLRYQLDRYWLLCARTGNARFISSIPPLANLSLVCVVCLMSRNMHNFTNRWERMGVLVYRRPYCNLQQLSQHILLQKRSYHPFNPIRAWKQYSSTRFLLVVSKDLSFDLGSTRHLILVDRQNSQNMGYRSLSLCSCDSIRLLGLADQVCKRESLPKDKGRALL
jgi:hypothetical protein